MASMAYRCHQNASQENSNSQNDTQHKVIYVGHGNATVFFSFSGTIVLEINYTTQKDEKGYYEEVKTAVHLKFDNAILGFLAKAASPILNPKLDKLINKFSMKIKKIVENAYTKK